MDLTNVHYKGMELVEFISQSMGPEINRAQYKSLLLDELERQNLNLEDFSVKELRLMSMRILKRTLPDEYGDII